MYKIYKYINVNMYIWKKNHPESVVTDKLAVGIQKAKH